MVLRNLTISDVLSGEITEVEGDGPASDRTYMNITVSHHKTAFAYGAAIIRIPHHFCGGS